MVSKIISSRVCWWSSLLATFKFNTLLAVVYFFHNVGVFLPHFTCLHQQVATLLHEQTGLEANAPRRCSFAVVVVGNPDTGGALPARPDGPLGLLGKLLGFGLARSLVSAAATFSLEPVATR